MGMKWKFCLLLLCGLPHSGFAQGEPGRFAISQVTFTAPALVAYVDTLDQNGQPPASLTPAAFSATMNQQTLKVGAVTPFAQTGEGVAFVFLVDISRSIQRAQFDAMRQQIDNWIAGMGPRDQMAIYTFGEQEKELIDFTSDKTALTAALATVIPTDNQTRLYLALHNAMDVGQRTDAGLPTRRVIVILSDGKDEGSGLTADDVGRMIQASPVPIYAIGFSTLPAQQKDIYLDALARVANLSGGLYVPGTSLPQAYGQIRDAIRRVFVVQLACAGCRISSQTVPLEMTLTSGTVVRTGQVAVSLALAPQAVQSNPVWKWINDHVSIQVTIPASIALLLAIGIPIGIIEYKKKHVVVPVVVAKVDPGPITVPMKPLVPGRKVQLTVISGGEQGRVNDLSLSPKAVIGRDKSCTVAYPEDDEMSAKHFELTVAGTYVEVQDLGSTNGTIINGSRLTTQQRVQSGDWVRAGRTELRITFGA